MNIIIPMLGFGKAGGHRVLSKLASEWVKNGHRVKFISPKDYHDLYYPTNAEIEFVPTIYTILPKFLKFKVLRDFFGILSLVVATISRARNFEIILANRDLTTFPTWMGCLANRKARGYYYIQAYEPDFYENKKNWLHFIAKQISAFTYRIPLRRIVNAKIYCDYKEISTKWVAPPGYDKDIFFAKKLDTWPPKIIRIGCIGRKQAWKGTAHIIDGVTLARQINSNITLDIAYELPDNCEIPPFANLVLPHGDNSLAEFYRSCDIIIACGTIQYGAFHYPSLESLACGTPLISSPYFPATSQNATILNIVDPRLIADAILATLSLTQNEIEAKILIGKQDTSQLTWIRAADKFINIFKLTHS